MTRIIALVGLALVIVAVTSTSALACITYGTPSVSAPNGQGGGQGTFRCLPNNKGTQKAAGDTPSPAVNNECTNNQ